MGFGLTSIRKEHMSCGDPKSPGVTREGGIKNDQAGKGPESKTPTKKLKKVGRTALNAQRGSQRSKKRQKALGLKLKTSKYAHSE